MCEAVPFPWRRVRQWIEIVENDLGEWCALIRHGRDGRTVIADKMTRNAAAVFALAHSRQTGLPFPTEEWHLSGGGFATDRGQGLSA